MSTVRIRDTEKGIVVESPFAYKDLVASIPGATWNPRQCLWSYPSSPWTARQVLHTIGREVETRGDLLNIDPMIRCLADDARPVADFLADIDRCLGGAKAIKHPRSRFDPWAHQYRGAMMISMLRACYLAWDMGTGKTKALIDAVLHIWSTKCAGVPAFVPVLLFCPSTVVEVWEREVPKHVLGEFAIAASRKKSVAKRVEDSEKAWQHGERCKLPTFIVTNYESVMLDSSPYLEWAASKDWEFLGLDEAHRLSNPTAKTTQAITRRIAPRARRRVALSGTPMRNDPLDLFSQCRILDPGIFGTTKSKFLDRYAILDFFGAVVGIQNKEELSTRFALIAHRVDKRKVLDLPPVVRTSRRYELCAEARKIYDELEREMCVQIGTGVLSAANAIVVLLRLQQITSGYAPVEEEEKATKFVEIDPGKSELLAEMLLEISTDEPAVVFCRFRRDLDEARRVATSLGRGYMEVSGRENQLREWQDAKGGEVIGVQIQSGGFGIDLTRAAFAFFYSVGFSRADYEQATARIDRPGQTRNTTIVNFIAKNTIDEAVYGAIESKGNVIESVLDRVRGIK